ncbi:MAG: hemerythrin domain-containing protein, partial [Planctomycetota bacterium]
FYQFKRHIEREEDIVFPYLRKYGWKGLCKADEDEHKKIVTDIDNLVALAPSLNTIKLDNFNRYLQKIVKHFVPMLLGHLSYEEELLWPIALVVVDDANIWETIKALSDEFEY